MLKLRPGENMLPYLCSIYQVYGIYGIQPYDGKVQPYY